MYYVHLFAYGMSEAATTSEGDWLHRASRSLDRGVSTAVFLLKV